MAFNKYTYIEQLMDFIRSDCDGPNSPTILCG